MQNNKRLILYIFWLVAGISLLILGYLELIDSFWSGAGTGFIVIGVLRLVQQLRLKTNEEYREKMETELQDERNRFIRNKAWAWAGYLFVIIIAVATIVLRVMGQELLSQAAGYALCLLLILYWGSYMILRKKY